MSRKSRTTTTARHSRESGNPRSLDSEIGGETLPIGWMIKSLSEIANYQTGRTPARATARYWSVDNDALPWVSISDMKPHGLITRTAESITQDAIGETFRGRISKTGTLLMSFKLTIGRVATLGVDACHNEAIISIYPKAGTNQKYLEYFLAQVDYTDYQDRAVKGHTLNQEKIDRIAITLPPEPEQQKIAAILWKLQRAIATQDGLIAATRDLKQSAMQRLFTHGLRGEALKETEIGLMPVSWEATPIRELREFLQYGTSTKCGYGQNGRPVIRIPNIVDGRVDTSDIKWADLTAKEVARYELASGDVIFIRTNGVIDRVGTCSVFRDELPGALFASYLIRARPNVRLNSEFYQYYSMTAQGRAQLSGRASPAADGKFNINTQTIDSVLVPLPSDLDEQRDIAAALATIDRKLAHHQRKRAALHDLFQTTLHQLMTAQIRVTALDIDTSEVTTSQPQGVAA